jgi:hypothetical protein
VRGTGPLAVHNLVEVIRRRNVGILHSILKRAPLLRTTKRCRVTASDGSAFPFGRLLYGTNPKANIMGYEPTRLLISLGTDCTWFGPQ